jgi:hypothetical protein
MKYIVCLLFLLLARPALTVGQKTRDENIKLLSIFFYRMMIPGDTANKITHFFSVKAELNGQGKVVKVILSKNTPAEYRDTLNGLKNLKINWAKIVPLKKGVKATIIMPVGQCKRTPAGIVYLASSDDIFQNVFNFEDGQYLFENGRMPPNVWLIGPYYIHKYIEYPPQE